MNFLAHTLLSCNTETILVGNFIADSVSNKTLSKLPPGIRKGVIIHRQIDTFTDLHPKVKESARILYPRHSKYAGVILDVYYDHFLSLHWNLFCERSIDSHTSTTYLILDKYRKWLPERMKNNFPLMVKDNFLSNYGSYEGLDRSFQRMRIRFSKPEKLDGVLKSLEENFQLLEKNFLTFFPELQTYVNLELCPERKDQGIF